MTGGWAVVGVAAVGFNGHSVRCLVRLIGLPARTGVERRVTVGVVENHRDCAACRGRSGAACSEFAILEANLKHKEET